MKKMKKILSLVIAMVMVLAMGTITAFADTTGYTITINNKATGHTYEAYQIFTGTLGANGELCNIAWGTGVSDAAKNALGDATVKARTLADETAAKAFAKTIVDTKGYLGAVAGTSVAGTNVYTISNLALGYYLVKDKDNSITNTTTDAYTSYIMKVVKNVTTNAKSDTVEVEKKVKDTNDTEGTTTDWQDSADYDIGDNVPFQLKATLPGNVSSYDTYKVVFHDTLSAGLTYNDADPVVKIDGKTVTGFTPAHEGTALTFTCADVKGLGAKDNSVITVEYSATLNENAVIGSTGNPNKVSLEYSNNPNHSGKGDNDTGNTPEDKVIVFTYKTIINKVDQDKKTLKGAAFKLEKLYKGEGEKKDEYKPVKEFTVDSENPATSFEFTGLDDGQYRLTETVTPDGYNTIDPVEFKIEAEHDEKADDPTLKTLTGNSLVDGAITLEVNNDAGSLTSDVVNQKGATLPETGGIGTKIFYTVGALLMICAGVVFVSRKRVRK